MQYWKKFSSIGHGPVSNRQCNPKEYIDFITGRKVLDVGCGTGNTLQYLKTKHSEAIGVTNNEDEIEIIKSKNLKFILSDMHSLPIGDQEINGIVLWDVIEHSPSPWILMAEMNRILAAEGRVVAFIPGDEWIDCPYHLNVYTKKQAEFLFIRTGFSIIESTPFGGGIVYNLIKKREVCW